MAHFTATWVQGNVAVIESPNQDNDILSFVHFGWGSVVVGRPAEAR